MPQPNAAILDTNVLLLHMVAITDRSLLATFKRVQIFEAADITLLERLLRPFKSLITTPHVLAEASNFIGQAPLHRRSELSSALRVFAETSYEAYWPSAELVAREEFTSLGLTDTALSSLSLEAVIVTTDYHLWGRILSKGGHSVNFNHLRALSSP